MPLGAVPHGVTEAPLLIHRMQLLASAMMQELRGMPTPCQDSAEEPSTVYECLHLLLLLLHYIY